MKSQIVAELNDARWSLEDVDMLLLEFNLGTPSRFQDGPSVPDLLTAISDESLIELYSIVLNVEPEIAAVSEDHNYGNWKPGYVRLFLSHSEIHKEFVSIVADELAVAGIHGFVAQDTMEYSKPWQDQIEAALQSMQAFVSLVHPEFSESPWCQQEIGWALGRRVPLYSIRLGSDPKGFIGHVQWPNGCNRDPQQIAAIISSWIAKEDALGTSVVEGMFSALRDAGNYYDAEAAVKRLTALETVTDEQFTELDHIWLSNDQLHGGVLPTRAMKPWYERNGRTWPPQETGS